MVHVVIIPFLHFSTLFAQTWTVPSTSQLHLCEYPMFPWRPHLQPITPSEYLITPPEYTMFPWMTPLNTLMFPSSTCLHTSSIIHPRHPPPHEILPLEAPIMTPSHNSTLSHSTSVRPLPVTSLTVSMSVAHSFLQHNTTLLLPAPLVSKNNLPNRSPEWHLHAGAWTTRALSPKQSSPCYRKVLPALRWTRKSLLWNLTLLPISVSFQSGLTTWKGLIFALMAGRTASSAVSST